MPGSRVRSAPWQRIPQQPEPGGHSSMTVPVPGDAPLISRRVFFGNPDKASPQISPDGAWLSWLAPVDGVLNVWVAPAEKPAEARPVTRDTGRGVRLYSWTYPDEGPRLRPPAKQPLLLRGDRGFPGKLPGRPLRACRGRPGRFLDNRFRRGGERPGAAGGLGSDGRRVE